jgi:hypothetical protein
VNTGSQLIAGTRLGASDRRLATRQSVAAKNPKRAPPAPPAAAEPMKPPRGKPGMPRGADAWIARTAADSSNRLAFWFESRARIVCRACKMTGSTVRWRVQRLDSFSSQRISFCLQFIPLLCELYLFFVSI